MYSGIIHNRYANIFIDEVVLLIKMILMNDSANIYCYAICLLFISKKLF